MIRILKSAFACLVALAILAGCKKEKDDRVPNLAPETTVSLKDYILADEANLTTTVRLYWSGSDQDGFVRAYQISQDGQNWSPDIVRTDSLFRFSFAAGNDTATIVLHVRSVDDKNLADATPAIIRLPLRNSPPTAVFDGDLLPLPAVDTLYTVISLPFRVTDPDGIETLDSTFISINDGPWYAMPRNANIISLVPEVPTGSGAMPAVVYLNGSATPQAARIQGLVLNGRNTFKLKTRDIAFASSPVAQIVTSAGTERSFYLKGKTADLLVLGSNQTTNPDPDAIYSQALGALGIRYDFIDLTAGTGFNRGYNQPRLFNTTMSLLLGLYPKVFWYMDTKRGASAFLADSSTAIIESVSPLLSDYIGAGGRLLLSSPFPSQPNERLPLTSPVFGLLPVDSIPYKWATTRLSRTNPVLGRQGYPDLTSTTAQFAGIGFMIVSPSAEVIYEAPGIGSTDPAFQTQLDTARVYRNRPVGVRGRNNQTGKVNLVFFSLELQRLSGNQDNFRAMLDRVLNQEFNQ